MTGWYVASLADGDTHRAEPTPGEPYLVTAHCDGHQFRPLTVLPGPPPDQTQTCPICRTQQGRLDERPAPRRERSDTDRQSTQAHQSGHRSRADAG